MGQTRENRFVYFNIPHDFISLSLIAYFGVNFKRMLYSKKYNVVRRLEGWLGLRFTKARKLYSEKKSSNFQIKKLAIIKIFSW